MEIKLENIAKINSCNIELPGVTIIAGKNNTGKSTIGKALYLSVNSSFNVEELISESRRRSIINSLRYIFRSFKLKISNNEIVDIKDDWRTELVNKFFAIKNSDNLESEISELLNSIKEEIEHDETDLKFAREKILKALTISDTDIYKQILNRYIYEEFHGQINSIFSKTEGRIILRNLDVKKIFSFTNNEARTPDGEISFNSKAIYLDSFTLSEGFKDFLMNSPPINHRDYLNHLMKDELENDLFADSAINKNRLGSIMSKLNSIGLGKLVTNNRRFSYQIENCDETLNIGNIASGLKLFITLKKLIENGSFQDDGILILDEPEVHLHPEWQVILADFIIALKNEFNLRILLTTHSPYFLEAIELYSMKYKIQEQTKYYYSEIINNEHKIYDTSNSLEVIYDKLAEPFSKLAELRAELDN